jgi:endonuclease G
MKTKYLSVLLSPIVLVSAILLIHPADAIQIESQENSSRHLKLGKPQAIYEFSRDGYALAEDARLKLPVWVQYELRLEDLKDGVERNTKFVADPSIPAGSRAEVSDYKGSGFDQGHMAPAADMARSQQVMDDCFLLSNIAPQVGVGFNRQIWKKLEDNVRGWVKERGTLTIIIGPAFAVEGNKVSYQVIGNDFVAVPTHFFKIIVDANNKDNITALAFLMPNKDLRGHDLNEYLVSIDEIEQLTGLNFLSALSLDQQEKIESKKAVSIWQ